MLLTFRVPLSDGRRFSNHPGSAESVVFPHSWGDGEFVRGLGRITRRPIPPSEPWKHEAAFADLHRTIRFSPAGISNFNSDYPNYAITKIRKRAWSPLLDHASSMLDIDLSIQLNNNSPLNVNYPRTSDPTFNIQDAAKIANSLSLLHVSINDSSGKSETVQLVKSGPNIASRYRTQTSNGRQPSLPKLVKHGRTIAVLEAPGLLASDAKQFRNATTTIAGIKVTKLKINEKQSSSFDLYILWHRTKNSASKRNIRAIRIHILRLHSIYSLLRSIASFARARHLSESRGTEEFENLQRELLSCTRFIQERSNIGNDNTHKLLNTVFRSVDLGSQLHEALPRTFESMRPRVVNQINELRYSEQMRTFNVGIKDQAASVTIIGDKILVNNSSSFEIHGNNYGTVGNNDKTSNTSNILNAPLEIEGKDFSRSVLINELKSIIHSTNDDAGRSSQVNSIIEALEGGDDQRAVGRLKKFGAWLSSTASAISAGTVVLAIEALSGIN